MALARAIWVAAALVGGHGWRAAEATKIGVWADSGDLFSDDRRIVTNACPYALDPAHGYVRSATVPRSLELMAGPTGRAGNKYKEIQNMLGLGFCCKSPLVTLTADYPFEGMVRQFDFSGVRKVPRDFAHLSETSAVCRHGALILQNDALNPMRTVRGLDKELMSCLSSVRLLGCEAKYMGPLFDASTCPAVKQPGKELAVHFRSGDIFQDGFDPSRHHKTARRRPPQPPLEYYDLVLRAWPWRRVEFVTHYYDKFGHGEFPNPAFKELKRQAGGGGLQSASGAETAFVSSREFEEDTRALLCADSISLPMSSLNLIWLWHGRAQRILIPQPCGRKVWEKAFDHLAVARPGVEIWGVDWPDYETYQYAFTEWNSTASRYMNNYAAPLALRRCTEFVPSQ